MLELSATLFRQGGVFPEAVSVQIDNAPDMVIKQSAFERFLDYLDLTTHVLARMLSRPAQAHDFAYFRADRSDAGRKLVRLGRWDISCRCNPMQVRWQDEVGQFGCTRMVRWRPR